MPIKLYNTLTRQAEKLKPLKKGRVGLYTCGPTVYNYAHIGNLRTYLFEDILKRTLVYNGLQVKHVMNITDVGHLTSDADSGEDKMEKGAKREGKTAWEIADFYTKAFLKDIGELNILPPNKLPTATGHIKEQITLVKKLEKKGFTYQTTDGIYFDTSKLPDYGKLANLKNQELKAGARVDMGDKKNPHDFALWKLSVPSRGAHPEDATAAEGSSITKRQMEWKSPWGVGFPGWHIECSAMATKYLGQPFDIHCGGIDHVPVHHTNEIAQSEAAFGKPLANVWMHGEFLLIGADKMAKSGENFITLQTIKDRGINPLAYRYFLLQAHYRKQLAFSWEALKAAESGLNHLYQAVRALPKKLPENKALHEAFHQHINNDLDIPGGLGIIWKAINEKTADQKTAIHFDEILGLEIKNNLKEKKMALPKAVAALAAERDTARAAKKFAESDRLRKELEAQGYVVEDTKDGTRVTKK
ncbi:MAG: cysteine--tRNA ligase [Candidatus Magasanikbacteria bacterium]|nr:cysteine--tRNA ligase [Candidatus Magasanikbacteria bacterium]